MGKYTHFSAPGRTELGGNHTDHQRGRVLCAAINLDIRARAAKNGSGTIRVQSEGFPDVVVELDDLSPRSSEQNSSAALVRGVAARIRELGYEIGGFELSMRSTIPPGSGLSSSAAYEILIGNVINSFFCGGTLSALELAKIGQYAESVYFGKPCGLMDQCGCSLGGAVFIDLERPESPLVRRINYDFDKSGHALCIIDSRSCHADLTADYAEITREMGAVAAHFGQQQLRGIDKADFLAELPQIRARAGDRAVLRALHFFDEDIRAEHQAAALERGDFESFLALQRKSGLSSSLLLQNIWSPGEPAQQAVGLVIALGEDILAGSGSIRVHGGGFAGTAQAFVPAELLPEFKQRMEALLGDGSCHVLRIRPTGGGIIQEGEEQ